MDKLSCYIYTERLGTSVTSSRSQYARDTFLDLESIADAIEIYAFPRPLDARNGKNIPF